MPPINWPPIEVIIAVCVAALVRMKSAISLSWVGAITTSITSVFASLVLYKDVTGLLGLSAEWHTVIAVCIALTVENLMKIVIDMSSDPGSILCVIKAILTRDPDAILKDRERHRGGEK